jgi:hypothetical protein
MRLQLLDPFVSAPAPASQEPSECNCRGHDLTLPIFFLSMFLQVLTLSFVQIRANPDLQQLAQSKGFANVDQYMPGLNYFQTTVSAF